MFLKIQVARRCCLKYRPGVSMVRIVSYTRCVVIDAFVLIVFRCWKYRVLSELGVDEAL